MLLRYKNLTIRNATVEDAILLANWWNDGEIMAYAGYPNGTGERVEEIEERIKEDTDTTYRRLIIQMENNPIGEMSYFIQKTGFPEIGIKICNADKQNQGVGRILLSMLINSLFTDYLHQKILISADLNNKRAQHVYKKLGFKEVSVDENTWTDEEGKSHSYINYELYQEQFNNFALAITGD